MKTAICMGIDVVHFSVPSLLAPILEPALAKKLLHSITYFASFPSSIIPNYVSNLWPINLRFLFKEVSSYLGSYFFTQSRWMAVPFEINVPKRWCMLQSWKMSVFLIGIILLYFWFICVMVWLIDKFIVSKASSL